MTKNKTKVVAVAKKLGIEENDLVYVGEGLWSAIVTITPEIAAEWLKYNQNNRTAKEFSIQKISEDMNSNNWQFTHQGLAFGLDCELKDGQNRLYSIINTKKAIKSLVFIGLSDAAKGVVDQNTARSPLDAAKFAGIKTTKRAISCAKLCEAGLDGQIRGISNSKSLSLHAKHLGAFDFVQKNLLETSGQKGIAVTAVCAAIMRAYYVCRTSPTKTRRLKKFCQILKDGQYNLVETDEAAFRLREAALNKNWLGGSHSRQLYSMTEEALLKFLDSASVRRLNGVKEEAFPLDGEEVA